MKKFLCIFLCIVLSLGMLTMGVAAQGSENAASVTYNGETRYFTDLVSAFNSANGIPGCKVTLLKDVDLGSATAGAEGGDFTFDLNGHTVSGSSFYAVLGIRYDAKLTITDSAGGGRVKDNSSTAVAVYGELVVNGGTLSSSTYGLMVIDGKVTVNGGKIVSDFKGIVIAGDLFVNGGEITGGAKAVEIVHDTQHYKGASCLISGGTVNGGIIIDYKLADEPIFLRDIFAPGYYLYDENGNPVEFTYTQYEYTGDVFTSSEECKNHILSVEYAPSAYATNTLEITVSGRASKVQLVNKNNTSLTLTYIRPDADSIVSYNESGEVVSDLSREIAYEVWTVTRYFDPGTHYVRAKFNNGWEALFTSYILEYKLSSDRADVYSITPGEGTPAVGERLPVTVETGVDVLKVQVIVNSEHIATYNNPVITDGKAVFNVFAKCYNKGENTVTFRIKTADGWQDIDNTLVINAE